VASSGNDCLVCSRLVQSKQLLLKEEVEQLFQWEANIASEGLMFKTSDRLEATVLRMDAMCLRRG
jgi:hypothetical protein